MQVCGELGISVRSALPPSRWLLGVAGVCLGLAGWLASVWLVGLGGRSAGWACGFGWSAAGAGVGLRLV